MLWLAITGCATTAPYPVMGVRRDAGCWLPKGRPVAVLLAVHGLNDHRGAFRDLATHLIRAGVAVYSYDQRGFGATPQRGQWPGVVPLTEDLRQRTLEMRWQHPGVPLFVLGESLGAAVALVAFSDYPLGPDGLVLSAPAVLSRKSVGPIRSQLLQIAANLLPDLALSLPEGITLTKDAAVRRQLARDPLLIGRTRLEVLAGALSLMDLAVWSARDVHMPALLLYGERDPVIPPARVERLAKALPGPVQLFGHDDYHLLLRGRAAKVSAERILGWLSQQLAYQFPSEAPTVTKRSGSRTTTATENPDTGECHSRAFKAITETPS